MNKLPPLAAAPAPQTASRLPYRPSLSMRLVLRLLRHLKFGVCHLVLPDGTTKTLRGAHPGIEASCVIHNDRVARRALLHGTLGFCESYLDGDWSSPDLVALFELIQNNEQALMSLIDGPALWRHVEGLFNKLRANTKNGSKRNIAYHYDLGNEFYATWLDETMTYSSGIFGGQDAKDDDLRHAQERKYAKLMQMLDLNPSHHLLEIGCGWGGFAEYAAKQTGCRITGLTISREQYDYARARMFKAGLADQVKIELCDYRDSSGQYDRIASIEMLEAVGEGYWPKFFETVHDRLRPGGLAAIQVITIAERYFKNYRKGADYIQKYVFPGGILPTFAHLNDHVRRANLNWRDSHFFGEHYARTLAEWRRRFNDNWHVIEAQGFGGYFRRLWEQYLCYCEAGFKAKSIDVCQFSIGK